MPKIEKFCANGVFDTPTYSQGIKVSDAQSVLFLAGQVAYDKDGSVAHRGDFKAQAREAFRCLEGAGGDGRRSHGQHREDQHLPDGHPLPRGSRPRARGILRQERAGLHARAGGRAGAPRLAHRGRGDRGRVAVTNGVRSKRPRPEAAVTGAHRSPSRFTRAGTLSMRKSSIASGPRSSSHVTGVETGARGRGRTEYTEASVRPHAFWLKSTCTRSRGRISLR